GQVWPATGGGSMRLNLKALCAHWTSSLSAPVAVTLTSSKLRGPSGAGSSGWARWRRSRASVISFNAGKQSQTLVIRCLHKPRLRCALLLLHLDQSDLIDQAVRGHRVAVARHAHVAHDVAAAGDRPALEFLRLRVEAYDRVRLGAGFVVPERALGEDDAVGLRLRSARRWPFLVLAGRKIEPPEIAAREIRVPDRVVGRERKTART